MGGVLVGSSPLTSLHPPSLLQAREAEACGWRHLGPPLAGILQVQPMGGLQERRLGAEERGF